jgi:DNA (cytosine-5)-methyltransferase 1
LSIEKDENAHKTLELRSFFRKFPKGNAPVEYYDLLRLNDNNKRENARIKLFEKYPIQSKEAAEEAWCAELGGKNFPSEVIDNRIQNALKGENNWVLIGGPPCQAYSIAGRSRIGGINEKDHRVYLYREYLRIIAAHHPVIFVMENVQGLLSAKINGDKIFHKILQDLKNPSAIFPELRSPIYNIYSFVSKIILSDNDYLIKTEEYGIPQKRHRVILLGIRENINDDYKILEKKDKVSLGSVIDKLPKIRSAINREYADCLVNNIRKRKYFKIEDSPAKWEEILNEYMNEIFSWNCIFNNLSPLISPSENTGSEFLKATKTIAQDHPLYDWYIDKRLGGIINHISRAHLKQDLLRYLYLSIYNNKFNKILKVNEYKMHSEKLTPDHKNASTGQFADRFRVQKLTEPASTITSHISKDGHYYIHYDYGQCRTLTVREAARIQTFPDNYLFCGTRTSQFHQVGNAVPPYLAFQLANIVKIILDIYRNI